MISPYIGITDFRNPEEVGPMVEVFRTSCPETAIRGGRRLMVGVMMSFKTLMGIPTKWAEAWPKKQRVGDLFIDNPLVLNALHYADFDGTTTADCLFTAVFYGGEHIHALQLDMIWPNPRMLGELRGEYPDLSVILQINAQALDAINNDPVELINRLRSYRGLISVALLDKSMGKGLGMDAQSLLPFARAIAQSDLRLALAAAGGLGPETLHLATPLFSEFPGLSVDAQSQLKPDNDPLKPTDWKLASEYLSRAGQMFS